MQRRDFVKGILAASAAAKAMSAQQPASPAAGEAAKHVMPPAAPIAPGPVPWMRGLMEIKPLDIATLVPDSVAQTNASFFTETQAATLHRLCEVMMPAMHGRPGALDAGAPEFLDFLIGVSPQDRQAMYREGLDWLDSEARAKIGVAFPNVNDEQAGTLIRPWLRAWMTDHPPTEKYARFINLAHADIRTATINSEVWSDAGRAQGQGTAGVDLYWYPVDPDVHRDGAKAEN